MLSRGYWIGESIDELATLSSQVSIRGELGLTDLHIFVENFFRDLLNAALGWSLENANQERHNFPGIDLIEKTQRVAIQVTATKTTEKINETLAVFAEKHMQDYDRLIVLIVGSKQRKYTLKEELVSKVNFSLNDIWDLATLSHKLVDLEVDNLQRAHSIIKKSIVKVKVELELPSKEGTFPTSASAFLEKIPRERMGDLKSFFAWQSSKVGEAIDVAEEKEYRTAFKSLVLRLKKLPRVSREFVAILLQERRRDSNHGWGEGQVNVHLGRIERMMNGFDVEGEINLLQDLDIVEVLLPEDYEGHFRVPQLRMFPRVKKDNFLQDICEFIETKAGKDGFMKSFAHLDFGYF